MLTITRVIWLHEYVAKIETKHHVHRDEIQEVLMGSPHVRRVGKGTRHASEHLYAAYGQREPGRYVVVFFIHKARTEALVISARDMDGEERKRYGRK